MNESVIIHGSLVGDGRGLIGSAQGKDEEAAEVGEQVVDDLDGEPVEVPGDADFFEPFDPVSDITAFDVEGRIGLYFMNAVDGFSDFAGKAAGSVHSFPVVVINAFL